MKGIVNSLLNILRQGLYRSRLGSMGEGAELAPTALLSYPKKIVIGAGCRIADNVVLRANTDADTGIRLGAGVQVHESVLIGANNGTISIGDRSWLAPFCLVYGNGNVTIGNDVLIAPRVSINTVSHHAERCDVTINEQGIYKDPVVIEDDVWIGMHAVILQGVTIGHGSIIGAGAVVNRDIPPWSIAVGSPAKVIRRREDAPQEDA